MERIAIIDYGMGNLRSVQKALQTVASDDQHIVISNEPEVISAADRVVFPGQGAIRDAMDELNRRKLSSVVVEALSTRPTLGICLGLQALFESSEESPETRGLGVFRGSVERFSNVATANTEKLKIPHMGWNTVCQADEHPLWYGIDDQTYFYFVHSYYVVPSTWSEVAATCRYGVEFVCAVQRGPLFAVQFHPEKSQHAGLTLLRNFLRWRHD